MHELQFSVSSPKKLDATLRGLIKHLGLDESSAVRMKFHSPEGFEPAYANCHLNVRCQVARAGGKPQHGWILGQDKAKSFCEAIFHTVWRAPDSRLFDVTPRSDEEKRLLFLPDHERVVAFTHHEGRPAIHTYDSVRVLGTSILTPLEEITVVLEGTFALDQGLWPW